VDESLRIHRALGPGLLESVYETLLARALEKRGFHVERQKAISFEYDGIVFEEAFRTDLIVDHQVIVELKSLEKLAPVHNEKTPDLSQTDKHAGWPPHQLRLPHPKGRPPPHRQWPGTLRLSAPPREPVYAPYRRPETGISSTTTPR
jgi:GxxExxY protein